MNLLRIITISLFACCTIQSSAQQIDSVQSLDGVTVYYELFGTGEPVYILTGGPGIHPKYMKEVATELSGDYQLVLLHQRGTGMTRIPMNEENIQITKYCQDIRSIKKKLEHSKITLLGHSWGGALAMHYATLFPGDLRRIILVGSAGYNFNFFSYFGDNIYSNLSEDDQNAVQLIEKLYEQADSISDEKEIGRLTDNIGIQHQNLIVKGYFYDKSKARAMDELTYETINMQVGDLMISSMLRAEWDLEKELAASDVKTVIIQGRQDPMGYETAASLHQTMRESELIMIEECGHFPWIEQPEDFYKVLNESLKEDKPKE